LKALLVLGAGGHGRVVADAALESRRWDRIAFLDDFVETGATLLGLSVIGTFSELGAQCAAFGAVVVGLGDARRRLEFIEACKQAGFELPCIIHPTASVSRFATLGAGTVVFAQAAINAGAKLGAGCIVNTSSSIDHDCALGDGVHVCPGAHLAGSVCVGEAAWIGVGASVRDGVAIGSGVTVGAGASVVANVSDGLTVVGVPARTRSPP
jgi:sugar O-acyltransferase (sialic acid O-acetyltransferase NeuD family)